MNTGLHIVRAVHAGEMLAEEALEHCIARIEVTDPRVNAFTDGTFERAGREARAIDARRVKGLPLPPLAGMPYAVKNLFDVEGVVTRGGHRPRPEQAAAVADALLVQRLHAAGAVLVGALNMDEFDHGFTTENHHYGPCRNPRDLQRTAGGSSGGCGAAVAAGQVPMTLGSDANGSIRVPSSLCGVWGLKPTYGRLSRRGSLSFVASLDHFGPFSRTVEDLSATYDALQGPDAQDPACHAERVQPTFGHLDAGIAGLRIGVLGGYFEDHAGPSAQRALAEAARVLGATGRVTWPDAEMAAIAAFIVSTTEAGTQHMPQLRERLQSIDDVAADRLVAGALQPAEWYLRAQRFRRCHRDRIARLFDDWDVLLAPATPVSATPLGADRFELNGQDVPARPSLGLLTQPVSFAGCPVIAAPLWPDGARRLPIGVQVIAAPWREDLALRAARVLEASGIAHSPIATF